MVMQSTYNYEQHKKDIFDIINDSYGLDIATKFVEFYSSRYDIHNKSFIDYRLAFWLLDDYFYVKKVGTRWYACVGIGGTGKSTLMTNIMYFFDPTFDLGNANMSVLNFVKTLKSFPRRNSMKGIYMDEPDDEAASHSKLGKQFRKIIGKARQQQLFCGICATDLKDIPTPIFRKLDGIFFLPYLGKCMFFKNRPRKGSYVLQKIRADYTYKGYKIFFELRNQIGCLTCDTKAGIPYTQEDLDKYLDIKVKDYDQDINKYIKMADIKDKNDDDISDRDKIILRLAKMGKPQREIGEIVGLSRVQVNKIIGKLKDLHPYTRDIVVK